MAGARGWTARRVRGPVCPTPALAARQLPDKDISTPRACWLVLVAPASHRRPPGLCAPGLSGPPSQARGRGSPLRIKDLRVCRGLAGRLQCPRVDPASASPTAAASMSLPRYPSLERSPAPASSRSGSRGAGRNCPALAQLPGGGGRCQGHRTVLAARRGAGTGARRARAAQAVARGAGGATHGSGWPRALASRCRPHGCGVAALAAAQRLSRGRRTS
jgi:hypothetical protein